MTKLIVIEKLNKPRKIPSKDTKLVLVGLTPGRRQHEAINSSENALSGSFKGMRKQIFAWFEILKISKILNIDNEDSIFNEKRFLKMTYITSLLREPVYIKSNGKLSNYSGRNPFPWCNDDLTKLMHQTLDILSRLDKPCLIVPMGQIVSEALVKFSSLDESHYILHGFPHPSGANGHRHREFEENCPKLKKIVRRWIEDGHV